MITISEKAANQVKSLQNNKAVRVSVTSGGCSGLSYQLDFVDAPAPTDEVFQSHNITLCCDKKSFFYLIGTELDFSDGLQGKGFFFNNPNASRTCACGESFSL